MFVFHFIFANRILKSSSRVPLADMTPFSSTAIYLKLEPGCPLDVSTTTPTPADLV